MKIRVSKLRETLVTLGPLVSGKGYLPILKMVLLKDGQAIAGDTETTVSMELPEAEEPMLLPHKELLELLKHVPGNETLTIVSDKGKAELSWDSGKASLYTKPHQGYPPGKEYKFRGEGEVDGDALIEALVRVSAYSALDTSRPVLNGVFLTLGDKVEVAASDGFRMAVQELPGMKIEIEGVKQVVIPHKAVKVLGEVWQSAPKSAPIGDSLMKLLVSKRRLKLEVGDQAIRASFGEVTTVVKLIQGTPPNYRTLIPEKAAQSIRVFSPDMYHALKRVKYMAKEGSGITRLVWDEEKPTVSSQSMDAGDVEASVAVEILDGGPGKVAVNVGYLLNYFQEKQGFAGIGVSGPGPVMLRDGSPLTVLLMPMSVSWGKPGEAKPTPTAEVTAATVSPAPAAPEDKTMATVKTTADLPASAQKDGKKTRRGKHPGKGKAKAK